MLNFLPWKHPENSKCTLLITVHVNIAVMLTQPRTLLRLAKVIQPTSSRKTYFLGNVMMQTVFFAPSVFLKLVQPSMKSSFFNTNNKVPTEQPFSSSTTLSRMLMDLQLGFKSSSLNVRRNRNPRSYKAFKTKPQEWLLKLKLTFALNQLRFLLYTKRKQSEVRRGK